MSGQDSCTLEKYVNGEDSIPVCMEFDSDRRDEFFCRILGMMHMRTRREHGRYQTPSTEE